MSEKKLEGRCITIARVRAEMTSAELAEKLYFTSAYVRMWERGVREPHWDELYGVLPELPEIREKGCAAYCPKASICKKNGICIIAAQAKTARRNKDIVEVVRCKDCRRGAPAEVQGEKVVRCPYLERCMKLDGFCSFGERREGE